MEQQIIEIIAKNIKTDTKNITKDTKMADIEAWDSLAQVMIMAEIEEKLGIYIPIDKALEIEGVADILAAAKE